MHVQSLLFFGCRDKWIHSHKLQQALYAFLWADWKRRWGLPLARCLEVTSLNKTFFGRRFWGIRHKCPNQRSLRFVRIVCMLSHCVRCKTSAFDTLSIQLIPRIRLRSHSWWSPPLWNTGGWGWRTLCQEGGVAKNGLREWSSSRKTVARQRNDSAETCDRFSRGLAWSSTIGRSLLLLLWADY